MCSHNHAYKELSTTAMEKQGCIHHLNVCSWLHVMYSHSLTHMLAQCSECCTCRQVLSQTCNIVFVALQVFWIATTWLSLGFQSTSYKLSSRRDSRIKKTGLRTDRSYDEKVVLEFLLSYVWLNALMSHLCQPCCKSIWLCVLQQTMRASLSIHSCLLDFYLLV